VSAIPGGHNYRHNGRLIYSPAPCPHKLRVQYPGAIYYLMNRGDQRDKFFRDDQDRHHVLNTLAQACQKTGWQAHAYCLHVQSLHANSTMPLSGKRGRRFGEERQLSKVEM
jgi:hypothetical protein